jgi:biotin synthase
MNHMNGLIERAYGVLDGKELDKGLAMELSAIHGKDIPDLTALAHKVRIKFSPGTHICTIMNAKSGQCAEDCRYCAQSLHSNADIETYPMMSAENILTAAGRAYSNGADCFGIVTSGHGYTEENDEFHEILAAADSIHQRYPSLDVGTSLGVLSDGTARLLAEHGIRHYNHNIQVNPSKYGVLVATTHTIEERMETLRLLKRNGIRVCSGGILGLGESMTDRVELAYALRDAGADIIPLNVLVPIQGTALEKSAPPTVMETAKTFAIFRLVNPHAVIKFAAGRETVMKDFQGMLMLAGVNGFLTGGYLTTRGRSVGEDIRFLNEIRVFYS